MITPPNLTGKEFEQQVLDRLRELPDVEAERSGQRAFWTPGKGEELNVRMRDSAPDIEGDWLGIGAFSFECKVESGASFRLTDATHVAPHQIDWLVKRRRVGRLGGLLIHWNARPPGKKRPADPAYTEFVPSEYLPGLVRIERIRGRIDYTASNLPSWLWLWHIPSKCRKPRLNIVCANLDFLVQRDLKSYGLRPSSRYHYLTESENQ